MVVNRHDTAGIWVAFSPSVVHSTKHGSDVVADRGNRAWWMHPGGGIDARPSYADWQKEDPMGLEVAAGRSAGFGATTPTKAGGGPRL